MSTYKRSSFLRTVVKEALIWASEAIEGPEVQHVFDRVMNNVLVRRDIERFASVAQCLDPRNDYENLIKDIIRYEFRSQTLGMLKLNDGTPFYIRTFQSIPVEDSNRRAYVPTKALTEKQLAYLAGQEHKSSVTYAAQRDYHVCLLEMLRSSKQTRVGELWNDAAKEFEKIHHSYQRMS